MSPFLKDLAERVVRTFVAAATAALVLPATDLYSMAAWKSAAVAAAIAGVTAVLGVITKSVGPSTDTASVLEK